MNKKIFILTALLLILITIINTNLYFKSSKKLKETYNNYISFLKKAKKYETLKHKYTLNGYKYIKKFCKKNEKPEIINIFCKTDISNLRYFSMFLKSNVKIKNFSIKENNSTIVFKAELYK